MRRVITANGHDVVEAADAIEALELVRELRIDAAFVDLVLPWLDGLALIRRLSEEGVGLKIVVMSGYEQLDELPEREAQVVATLRKPFTVEDVTGALEAVVGRPGAEDGKGS